MGQMGQMGQAGTKLPVTQRLSIPWEPTTLKAVFIPLSSQTDAPTVQHHHLHLQPRSSGANFPHTLGAVIGSVVVFAVLLILWRCCASNGGNSRRTSSSRSRSPGPPKGSLPVMAEHPASLPLSQQNSLPAPPPDAHQPEGGSQEEASSLESDEGTDFDPKPQRPPVGKVDSTLRFFAIQNSLVVSVTIDSVDNETLYSLWVRVRLIGRKNVDR